MPVCRITIIVDIRQLHPDSVPRARVLFDTGCPVGVVDSNPHRTATVMFRIRQRNFARCGSGAVWNDLEDAVGTRAVLEHVGEGDAVFRVVNAAGFLMIACLGAGG